MNGEVIRGAIAAAPMNGEVIRDPIAAARSPRDA
jgi:hypothetical protein